METKLITSKNLKVGQEIKGTKGGGWQRMFSGIVKSVNAAYVTVDMWGKGEREEKIDASYMFYVELTEKEIEEKYKDKAKEILKNIQNRLHRDEIGYHEMWNTWVYGTPYEMASYCVKNKMNVIGHSTEIIPKMAMFSGDILDVGVCAEYENGERFWCHCRSSDIKKLLDRYKYLIDEGEKS